MSHSRDIALAFLRAYYRGEPESIREVLAEDVCFEGPGAKFSGAERLVATSAHVAPSATRLDVRKVFVDKDDVCIIYDVQLNHEVQSLTAAQWFVLHEGKIASMRMIFDSAPFSIAQGTTGAD